MISKTSRYRIVDLVAAGGMGVVYRAEDVALNRTVALKFLPPETAADEEYRARFLREARVAAALNHPNTCTVYEVGEVQSADDAVGHADAVALPGTPFIAMEFIDGETLADWLSRGAPRGALDMVDVALQIAEGLAEAHARRIVHRDLKPQNVMITSGGRVKIVDFGLAKPLKIAEGERALISTSEMISADLGARTVIGTYAYMSPEQASGRELDPRSDVFAFGIILYQMVARRLPFQGDTPTEVLAKILEVDPDPLPARVPGALTRIIRRSLQKKPDDRYDDARGLVADLREVGQRLGKDAARRDVLRKARQRFGAGRGWRAVPAILLLALTPLSCWLTLRSRETAVARTITVALGHRPAVNQASSPRGRPERTDATMATASMPIVAPPSRPRVETARSAREEPPRPRASRLTEFDGTNTGAASSPNSGVLGEPAASDAAQPPHVGALAVSSNPRSSVSIDGTLVGVTPLTVDAGAGTHEVSLASSDGTRWRGRVEVRAGQPITLHRELGAIGRLTITSDVWVEVSLDGGPAEQTPIHFPRVSTGLHELRAFRDGYVTKHMEIFIEEEKTSTVRLELERR